MLWLDYPKETATFAIDDEFLIGELLNFLFINCRRLLLQLVDKIKKKKKVKTVTTVRQISELANMNILFYR